MLPGGKSHRSSHLVITNAVFIFLFKPKEITCYKSVLLCVCFSAVQCLYFLYLYIIIFSLLERRQKYWHVRKVCYCKAQLTASWCCYQTQSSWQSFMFKCIWSHGGNICWGEKWLCGKQELKNSNIILGYVYLGRPWFFQANIFNSVCHFIRKLFSCVCPTFLFL